MTILIRVLLFALLIYLIIKMIREFLAGPKEEDTNVKSSAKERKVSRDVGEYVDFEEVKEGKGQRAKGEGHTGERTGKEQGAGSKGSRVSDKGRGTRDFR